MNRATPVYDSASKVSAGLEEVRQVVRYRDLVYQLVRRDILTRYKRSVLGVAWTMLNPLGMMIVLTLAFSQLFTGLEGYAAYVLSGLIAWTFFSQTTTAAMYNIVWGNSLMHRIYLPRTVFAISSIGTGLVNLLLSLVPMLVVMIAVQVPLRWAVLFLPVAMVLLALFSLGVGLLLSTLAVYFPDVAEMYQIVLLAWMYLTPIIYPENIVPESYRFWMFNLNPLYHLIKLFRLPLYEGMVPSPVRVGSALAVSVVMLALGWFVFTRKAADFSYHV
jgi:ABC-type polysaccharide/polyol phosphate export permease